MAVQRQALAPSYSYNLAHDVKTFTGNLLSLRFDPVFLEPGENIIRRGALFTRRTGNTDQIRHDIGNVLLWTPLKIASAAFKPIICVSTPS